MRYVRQITQDQVDYLRDISRRSRNYRERERAKAILLSYKGYNVTVLSDIFEVTRGLGGLKDLPKQLNETSLKTSLSNKVLTAKTLMYN
jgi:hypothetical protein